MSNAILTWEQYTQIDADLPPVMRAVNQSRLKHMAASPLHFKRACHSSDEDTVERLKGRVTHCLILEPHLFNKYYAIYDGAGTRATKEYKAWAAEHEGKGLLKRSEFVDCQHAKEAVMANQDARKYLECGIAEHTLVWVDPETHVRCKGRVDFWSDRNAFLDVKAVETLSLRELMDTAYKQSYHTQAEFYLRGHAALHNDEKLASVMIAYEIKSHDVAVLPWNGEALQIAEQQNTRRLQRVAECRASGVWPGRYQCEQEISLPGYAFQAELDLGEGAYAEQVENAGGAA